MTARPPRLAERILKRLVPSGIVGESMVGDAREAYAERSRQYGRVLAWLRYWLDLWNIAITYRHGRTRRPGTHVDRPVWLHTGLSGMRQDVRFAWRSLVRSGGFTAIVVATLGLGIGATTAIFSVLNGVLLKPLPFPEADRLVTVWLELPGIGLSQMGQADATYFTFRDEQRVFEDIGLWTPQSGVPITGLSHPETVSLLQVSAGTLPLLGTRPVLGRLFAENDDAPGAPLTAILSHGYWQSHFGGDADAIGQTLTIEDTQAEIVGVLPPNFRLLWSGPDVLIPLQLDRANARVGTFNYPGIARLKPGVTLDTAGEDLRRLIPRVLEQYPGGFTAQRVEETQLAPLLIPLMDEWIGGTERVLWLLFAGVVLVLVIACANVANLMLVRADGRQREIAVRIALGAPGTRIAREFLVESVVLAVSGGVLGIALAAAGVGYLRAASPGNIPRLEDVQVDPRVLAFTLLITLAVALLFGAVPALRARTTNLVSALGEGGRSSGISRGADRTRSALVIMQIAMALVLSISSGLMVRSLQALRNVDPGYAAPNTILTARLSFPGAGITDPANAVMHEQIARAIEGIPGVTSVGASTRLPMNGGSYTNMTHVQGRTDASPPSRRYKFISASYFETMKIPLLAGRTIAWSDVHSMAPVAMVNERFSREYWDDPTQAVGKMIAQSPSGGWRQIVGVVGNVRDDGLNRDERALVYWPIAVTSFWGVDTLVMNGLTYAIRTSIDPSSIAPQVRAAIWSVNPNVPIMNVMTQREVLFDSTARTSFTMTLLGIASAIAVLLGVVGLYGMIAYTVALRSREIGIRLALGAKTRTVTSMMVRRGLSLAVVGIAVGLTTAVATTRLMAALLFAIQPVDALTYGVMATLLVLVALLASYLPARRAASVDPARTLYTG